MVTPSPIGFRFTSPVSVTITISLFVRYAIGIAACTASEWRRSSSQCRGSKALRGIGAASYRQNRREQFGSVGLLLVDRISVLHPAMRGNWRFLDADACLPGQTVFLTQRSERKEKLKKIVL